jgi:hypothetical protein
MTEQQKPDLSSIEPIGRVPDADDQRSAEPVQAADDHALEAEAKTSPETEAQLEELRRG